MAPLGARCLIRPTNRMKLESHMKSIFISFILLRLEGNLEVSDRSIGHRRSAQEVVSQIETAHSILI
jgi:hypothetical protein